MEISMRDIIKRKYDIFDHRGARYMSYLQIACLIASEELNIPIYKLHSFRHYKGCLFINVEIR